MILRVINAIYRRFLLPIIVRKQILSEQNYEEKLVLENFSGSEKTPLTDEEKIMVCRQMGVKNLKSFSELGLFKKYRGFDPRYISHFMYLPILAHKLNNYHYSKLYEHKSLLGTLSKDARFAECYVRCIDQEYYSNQMNQLSRDEVIEICSAKDILIINDSVDSAGGKSVEKLVLLGLSAKEKKDKIVRVLNERKYDFVIQECIKQHPSMAKFNESSINTFRVTTLYLNGVFSVLSIVLRFGKRGMPVDNWGSGGIMIGVSSEGKLNDFGYDIQLNKYYEYNDVTFKNEIVSQIPSILQKVEDYHKNSFSLCKFIGWDICLNENNDPIVIELNSSQPGVIGEQLCTGPIFGDRTDEVITYCNNKKFIYNKHLFRY